MRIALVQQHATHDREDNLQRGLDALTRAADSGAGAELVVGPQAGGVDEWPEGLYEAELRVAAFQNGYFTALCNRVGAEECITFCWRVFRLRS